MYVMVLVQDVEKTKRSDGSNIIGQKSEKALVAAAGKKGKRGGAAAGPFAQNAKMRYNKSGSVFKRMQEQKEAAAAGIVPVTSTASDGRVGKKATTLKL